MQSSFTLSLATGSSCPLTASANLRDYASPRSRTQIVTCVLLDKSSYTDWVNTLLCRDRGERLRLVGCVALGEQVAIGGGNPIPRLHAPTLRPVRQAPHRQLSRGDARIRSGSDGQMQSARQPLRSKHFRLCDKCVARSDHAARRRGIVATQCSGREPLPTNSLSSSRHSCMLRNCLIIWPMLQTFLPSPSPFPSLSLVPTPAPRRRASPRAR
ncbi:hypothetical protein MSAN_00577800 [Mycena sanguinolenta]|uniref:Uncharacterized protein n=1 Tax=Mycena sanguinolenta TaxID=230812 RepID=A0A8H6ZAH3_9AGAR|nr:hypothetical protein MSAN_00577800 [Mycena sanguinolenta]